VAVLLSANRSLLVDSNQHLPYNVVCATDTEKEVIRMDERRILSALESIASNLEKIADTLKSSTHNQ
jgi:hypothetical protein